MKGRAHSDHVKAQVLAALLAGQSVTQVAQRYKVPRGTVAKWRAASPPKETVETQKEVGELVLDYLRENLITLRAQAEFFRDREWLFKQDAADLAVLHGVSTDKAIRLLEALEGEPNPDGSGSS